MAFLRIDKLSFAYPDARTRALDEISFSIDKGEYLVICGESGCGKTTLLRQIKPELTPAGAREGTVYFHDKNVHGMSPEETAVKIGFVQQDPDNQIVTDFVWHELAFGLENMALPTSAIRRRVSEMASFFGMEDWFHKKTYELSGGQKQMLNLASIMAMNPELLVLDEPTSMLDPLASQNLLQMVSRINRELGVAVIICEHRLEEVFQTADRVLLMEKGQIQLLDTPQWVAEELSRNLTDSSKNISRIYPGLPGAVRIFSGLRQEGLYPTEEKTPISIREARNALPKLLENTHIHILPDKKIPTKESQKHKTVLEARELWFRYQEKSPDVLRGLSLSVGEGELTALLGGNGSGKSTLLKLLSGVSKPLRGKVKMEKGRRLAMLPQSPKALFTTDTLWEDLMDSADGNEEKAKTMAARMNLSDKIYAHPYDLSGGELQRAAIGKLLLRDADLLLLDEPTKGLDAGLKGDLAGYLKELCREGISILLVTHDLEFAAAYADRCALLFDGQIVSEEEPHAFFSGNRFYTTSAGLIAGDCIPGAITCEEVIAACRNAASS